MKPWNDKRWMGLSVFTVFLLFIFVWGTVSIGQGASRDIGAQSEEQPEPKVTASGTTVDIGELTERLLNEVEYETTLELMDSALSSDMVDIADNSVMELYMGEGTSADELLVIRSVSEADAKQDQ